MTKDDIIKALVSQLTNLVLEQRGNEISSESFEDEEVSSLTFFQKPLRSRSSWFPSSKLCQFRIQEVRPSSFSFMFFGCKLTIFGHVQGGWCAFFFMLPLLHEDSQIDGKTMLSVP